MKVVPRHSACIPGARDASVIGISDDHEGMVRYPNKDSDGYKAVIDTLREMKDKLPDWRKQRNLAVSGQTS